MLHKSTLFQAKLFRTICQMRYLLYIYIYIYDMERIIHISMVFIGIYIYHGKRIHNQIVFSVNNKGFMRLHLFVCDTRNQDTLTLQHCFV